MSVVVGALRECLPDSDDDEDEAMMDSDTAETSGDSDMSILNKTGNAQDLCGNMLMDSDEMIDMAVS